MKLINIIHNTKHENELTELEDLETGDWGGRSTAKGEDSRLYWPRGVCGWLPMEMGLMKDIKYENELTGFEDIETGDWGGRLTAKGEDSRL